MKFIHQVLTIACIGATLLSCDNANKKNQESTMTEEIEVVEVVEKSENPMSLNDGKRWMANSETTEGINNMIALTNAFDDFETIASYRALEENLQSEFTTIFEKCTMKGEAHNQLHNFLLPLKDKFENLNSDNLSTAKSTISDLKMHLAIYKDYFE